MLVALPLSGPSQRLMRPTQYLCFFVKSTAIDAGLYAVSPHALATSKDDYGSFSELDFALIHQGF